MSTRGLWGFTLDGITKVTYNHFDSYPGGLGRDLAKSVDYWPRFTNGSNALREKVRKLRMVSESAKPSTEDIERLSKFADTNVSTGSLEEWYVLLHDTQGDLEATLQSGYMIDSFAFGFDSLFCEWGYVIDLDRNEFVVYEGFQNSTTDKGLWANGQIDNGYGPIAHVATFPLIGLDPDAVARVGAEEDEEKDS